jgi:hypothetical protein
MRIKILFFFFSFLLTLKLFPQIDTSLIIKNNLVLWLKADTGLMTMDSLVTSWKDISGDSSQEEIIQNDTSHSPKIRTNVINGNSALFFDGDDFLYGGDVLDFDTSKGMTLFIVGNNHGNNGTFVAKSLFGNSSSSINRYSCIIYGYNLQLLLQSQDIYTIETNYAYDTINILSWKIDKTKMYLRINGITNDSTDINLTTDMNSNYQFIIGAYNNTNGQLPPREHYFLNGYIAEILIYDTALTYEQQFHVENYLRYKYFPDLYQPPIQLNDSLSINYGFCDTTISIDSTYSSYIWSTGDTSYYTTINKSGIYKVTVYDYTPYNYVSSDSIFVQYPEPEMPFSDTTLCLGDTLIWDLALDSTLYFFAWSNGDTTQYTKIYAPGGNYYCIITDTNGCQKITDTIFVSIDSFPSQQLFSLNDTNMCSGEILYPDYQQIYNTLWNTSDTTPFITVEDSGTYSLYAEDSIGCHTIDSIDINITGIAPDIDFSWQNYCFGDTTFLINTSTTEDSSTFTSFVWQIDTLQTDTAFQTSILFPDTLSYQVTLHGLTSNNCHNSATKQIKIYPLPQVSFNLPHICQHTQVNITPQATSSYPIENFSWQLDNIYSATTQVFTYVFDSVSTHNLTLRVTDEHGCSNDFSSNIQVLPSPQANFYNIRQCEKSEIILYDSSITEFYNPIIASYWLINDTLYQGNTLKFIPQSSGYYSIAHIISSVNGCKDTIVKNIRVYPSPDLQFPDTINLCANTKDTLAVHLPDSILPANYLWLLDSTIFSNECCPQIVQTDTGIHSLKLEATTLQGCSDTATAILNVLPQPNANFKVYYGSTPVEDNYLLSGMTYHAVATDSTYPLYFWSSFHFDNPEFINEQTGSSTTFQTSEENGLIVLRVVDQNGCSDTSYFSYHTFLPSGNLQIQILDVSYTANGKFIFPIVLIKNNGNSPSKPFIACELKGSGNIIEQVDSTIYPGEIYTYNFNSGIEQKQNPLVLCSYVVYPWGNNYNHNSEKCITSETSSIKVLNLYPQPANNELNIDLIFNKGNGEIYFYFINSIGQKTAYYTKSLSKGYNNLKFNISSLPAGEYLIKIIAGSHVITKKFLKK